MKAFIFGAQTLSKFTEAIQGGFKDLPAPDFELWQVHASPASRLDDLRLLEHAKISNSKKIFLIHRPDELLLYPELKAFFVKNPRLSLVFLGDLVLKLPFWEERKKHITVIPHPFTDLSLPAGNKYVIGSFTSWGEMRKLEHFIELTKVLGSEFECWVGGTLDGRALTAGDVPSNIQVKNEFFIPHFNVQLYHLNGQKRLGESSGSLHRGVSIPVIFEANGIERTEGLKVIKIQSDLELKQIDYNQAARDISRMLPDLNEHLNFNLECARQNQPKHFAQALMSIILPNKAEVIL